MTFTKAWAAVGLALLVMVGYVAAVDARVLAAVMGTIGLAAWVVLSCERWRLVLFTSFLIVLIAGTKFRLRDPTASLGTELDTQILLELALYGLVGVGLLTIWLTRGNWGGVTARESVVFLYVVVALLSTLWSLTPLLTLVRAVQLLVLAGLAVLAVRLLAEGGALAAACTAVALYVLACAGLAMTYPWASGAFTEGDRVRLSWFSVHPITAGTLAAIAALGLLSARMFAPRQGATGRLVACTPLLVAPVLMVLVLTRARGPLLAFLASAGVLTAMRMRLRARHVLVTTLVCSAVLFLTGPPPGAWLSWAAEQDSPLGRMFLQGQAADALLGLSGRVELWQQLGPLMEQRLLLGHGYQASRSLLLDVASWASYAHNALLQTVLDLGLVGAVALIAIVGMGLFGSGGNVEPGGSEWPRRTAIALMVFLVINSITSESFAAAPGFETSLLFICALSAASSGASHVRVGDMPMADAARSRVVAS